MPAHFGFICDYETSDLFDALTAEGLQYVEGAAVSPDKKFAMMTRYFKDEQSDETFLHCVYTLKREEKAMRLLDVDIVVPHTEAAKLHFLELLPDSSDADEYYLAEGPEEGVRLELETVNRHLVDGELLDKEREVYLTAIPTSLRVYDDIDNMNLVHGWNTELNIDGQHVHVNGLSEIFMAPGSLAAMDKKERGEDDYHTILVGTVKEYEVCSITIGEYDIEFGIAKVATALGIMPTLIKLSHPGVEEIKPGKVLMMTAIIKADFAEPVVRD